MERRRANPGSLELEAIVAEQQAAGREQLESFWRALEYAFEERLAGLAASLGSKLESALAGEREAGRAAGRQELAGALNQAMRRLRQAESRGEWTAAVLDAAAPFCRRAAVFAVWEGSVEALDARGLAEESRERLAGLRVPLEAAPALERAVQTGEAVMASWEAGELSEALTAVFGEASEARAWLAPIRGRERVAALLLGDGEESEVQAEGLELVAAMAGAPAGGAGWPPVEEAGVRAVRLPGRVPRAAPEWNELSRDDQELHLRAQRFARVQVAEIRLYKAEAVQAGRARRDLYAVLRAEIDAGREAFRVQFLESSPSMVDYFHRELVRTLANEDEDLLGEGYPGPLA